MASESQQPASASVVEQYRALLAVSEAIISNRDLGELFRDLARRLSSVVTFDYVSLFLHDAERDVMRLLLWQTPDRDMLRPGWECPAEGTAAGWVWRSPRPGVGHALHPQERFPLPNVVVRGGGAQSLFGFPLTPSGRRLGGLG